MGKHPPTHTRTYACTNMRQLFTRRIFTSNCQMCEIILPLTLFDVSIYKVMDILLK